MMRCFEEDSAMKTYLLIDLGRASVVTASNAFGLTLEGDGSGQRIYVG